MSVSSPSAPAAIACCGELLVDQVVAADGQRQDYLGGAPANVATALARLGIPARFIGCVGTDAVGHHLVAQLTALGVDCAGVQFAEHPTRIVEVRCNAAGDRAFGGFVGGATTTFADAHCQAAALAKDALQGVQALVTGTLGLAYPATGAAMQAAAHQVQGAGGYLVVDLNWRPTFWPEPQAAIAVIEPWLQRADWLKLSVEDAIAVVGTTDLEQLRSRFPKAQGILLTAGEQGCHYAIAEQQGYVPAFPVTAIDTTGAGDAFLAGVLYQLQQWHWQIPTAAVLREGLTFASAMGALTTLQPGAIAAQPTLAAIAAFLATHALPAQTI